MKLKDVPQSPAYAVFHDGYDKGAMEIWLADSIEAATEFAKRKQNILEDLGHDDCGSYKAYTKLPHIKVYKLHTCSVEEINSKAVQA